MSSLWTVDVYLMMKERLSENLVNFILLINQKLDVKYDAKFLYGIY